MSYSPLIPQSTNTVKNQNNSQLTHNQTYFEQSATKDLEQLKSSLQISKQELILIISKNHFSQKVSSLNNVAKQLIEGNRIQEALIYLNEAQKILQYAASSGKNIQRKSIIQVLHNQACCHQFLWDFEKCASYIQALIFNINSQLKSGECQNNNPPQVQTGQKSPSNNLNGEFCAVQKKISLSKYHLLYCAINSQLKNNQDALKSVKNALQIVREVIQQLLKIYENQKKNRSFSVQKFPPFIHQMFQEIPNLKTQINPFQIQDLCSLVRHYIKVYNFKCVFNNLSNSKNGQLSIQSHEVYRKYKNFSLSNIMQLQPVGEESEPNQNINQNSQNNGLSYEKLIEKLIILSVCYFTTATELRCIAVNRCNKEKQFSYQTTQFKQSQVYHLISILIITMYMPFDTIYTQHIITSYQKHYKRVLMSNSLESTSEISQEQIKRIKENIVFSLKASNFLPVSNCKNPDVFKKIIANESKQTLAPVLLGQDVDQQKQQYGYSKQKSVEQNRPYSNNLLGLNSPGQTKLFDKYYYEEKDDDREYCKKISSDESNPKKNQPNLKLFKGKTKRPPIKTKFKSKSKSANEQIFQFSKDYVLFKKPIKSLSLDLLINPKPAQENFQKDKKKYFKKIKSPEKRESVENNKTAIEKTNRSQKNIQKSKSKQLSKNNVNRNLSISNRVNPDKQYQKHNNSKKVSLKSKQTSLGHGKLVIRKKSANQQISTKFKSYQIKEEYFQIQQYEIKKNSKKSNKFITHEYKTKQKSKSNKVKSSTKSQDKNSLSTALIKKIATGLKKSLSKATSAKQRIRKMIESPENFNKQSH